VSERVSYHPITIAPEHIRQGHPHFGARCHSLIENGVHVFYVNMDCDRRSADTERPQATHLRKLIDDEEP
jgi:hypothetical protein